ncbi:ParA family protein [Dietzia cinnamea]|uniref:ParA family protein n=1 Tax=Dietzia cinnamea TaxID=321318 RepID=UPI00223C18FE|nr:ParA family protein [Dietzia cinnamea]MCT2061625.1 ParA family protein [Dietzia cinnamea]MCT2237740.1 ParA family protein [Dietzia cinnamea]
MKIAVVNTKGGVGKTTTAVYLATVAAGQGESTELLDADPQGSATSWAEIAAEGGTPLPFPVTPANKITLARPGEKDLTVIDTPPGAADIIQAAIDAADVVVVPTAPSGLDLQRVWPTLEASAHKPAGVLITSAELGTKLLELTKDALEDEGVFVFENIIGKRQAIRQAFGTVPMTFYGYRDLLDEIIEVTK